MNKERRKQIEEVLGSLSELKERIEAIRDDEQEYFDNMPESFQMGERGQLAELAASSLDDAVSTLDDVENYLQVAME